MGVNQRGKRNISDNLTSIAAKLIGLAILIVPVMSLVDPSFLYVEPKSNWFAWSIGIGVIGLGTFAARGAPLFGLVVFSIFAGGAAQLWLTEPLWFPQIQLRPKSPVDLGMYSLIAAQAGMAVWLLLRAGIQRTVLPALKKLGLLRLVLFAAVSFAFSVSPQGFLLRGFFVSYGLHLFAATALIVVNLASIGALQTITAPRRPLRGFNPVLPALTVLAASAALSWFSFERLPHVEDEAVYLFQAQTFAQGALAAPEPPKEMVAGLEYYLLDIRDGSWFATTPPGWSAVLALGVLANVPWLVNPLLGMLSILLAHGIARQMSGRMQADILVLLMATSPWFLGASASLMPHNTSIFFILLSWRLMLFQPKKTKGALVFAALAGMAMGWVFATRQLEGALIGSITGAWLLWRWRKGDQLIKVVLYSAGAVLTGSAYLLHNMALTGQILTSPLALYIQESWQSGANAYGFGPGIGPPSGWGDLDMAAGHWPMEGVINTAHNLSGLQLELLGWGTGSLALVLILFLWGRPNTRDFSMLGISCLIVGAMFFYWFSGGFYLGPRYWFSLIFPVMFLSASGYFVASNRLKLHGVQSDAPAYSLLILCLFGLLVFTPWRGVEKYHDYNAFGSEIGLRNSTGEFGNALVFFTNPNNAASDFYLNDPFLPDHKPIFLMDLGTEVNQAVIDANPDRGAVYVTIED